MTALQGIQLIGIQGGYVAPPAFAVKTSYTTVAYHYYDGSDTAPSRLDMAAEIERYIDLVLPGCIENATALLQQGYTIETGNVSSDVTIADEEVAIHATYPITLTQEATSFTIDSHAAVVPVRLGHIHDITQDIVSTLANGSDWIDMTYLSGFDVDIDVVPEGDNLLFMLSDTVSAADGGPYLFLFGAHFETNSPPVLDAPFSVFLEDGTRYRLTINATDPDGDIVTFSDDTVLFDITENGTIDFIADVPGIYNVTIAASDGYDTTYASIVFAVEET
jgi:hypothetical protein